MRIKTVAKSGFRSLAFAPRGDLLATGHDRGAVRLWDRYAAAELASAETHAVSVTRLFFSPDAGQLFASQWGHVFHWRIEAGSKLVPGRPAAGRDDGTQMHLPTAGTIESHSLTITPDGTTLVGGDTTVPLVYFWPLDGSEPYVRLIDHRGYGVTRVAIRPDGGLVASAGSLSGNVALWDPRVGPRNPIPQRHGRMPFSLEEPSATLAHPAMVIDLAFSPDGQFLATLAGRTLRVWDVSKNVALFKSTVSAAQPQGLAFAPTGRIVATAGNDRGIKFWDAQTGVEQSHFEFAIGRLSHVAFSPDGTMAAAGGMTRKMVLWDLE